MPFYLHACTKLVPDKFDKRSPLINQDILYGVC